MIASTPAAALAALVRSARTRLTPVCGGTALTRSSKLFAALSPPLPLLPLSMTTMVGVAPGAAYDSVSMPANALASATFNRTHGVAGAAGSVVVVGVGAAAPTPVALTNPAQSPTPVNV